MSCEKMGVAVVEKSGAVTGVTTEPRPVRYFEPEDVNFGGGESYRATVEKRAAEIRINPRFSI